MIKLGDVAEVQHGWAFKGEHAHASHKGAPRLIRIGNFATSRGDTFRPLQTEGYVGPYPERFNLDPGDLLIALTCQTSDGSILGWPMRVPQDGSVYLHNQRIGRVVVKASEKVLLSYLEYLFCTANFNDYLFQTASGSKILHTAPARIEDFEFELPSLDEQRRIAEAMGALDDLIDTNERLATQLLYLVRLVSERARDRLVPLRAFGEVAPLRTVKPSGPTAHYSLPAYDNGKIPDLVEGAIIKSGKLSIGEEMVLVSRLNPHIPRVWAVFPDPALSNVASTEFVPIRGVGASTEEIYAVTSGDAYIAQLASRVTGTTGSHQRVDKTALLDFLVPDVRTLDGGSREAIISFVREAHSSRTMSAMLRRTRDELLPLLMSGKVRVRSAENAA